MRQEGRPRVETGDRLDAAALVAEGYAVYNNEVIQRGGHSMAYALDMLPQPKPKVPCLECGRCCTYVAVGINTPKTLRYATDVLWYLYHEKVSVLLDGDGEWSVVFETRCRNLQPDLKCATYPTRPEICREYDDVSCEVNDPDERARTFTAPDVFLEYLKTWRPKVYKQVAAGFLPSPASVAGE